MNPVNLNPESKTDRSRAEIHWLVQPVPITFTFEECLGDLADKINPADQNNPSQEITPEYAGNPTEMLQTPNVEPDDFEQAFCWFIS